MQALTNHERACVRRRRLNDDDNDDLESVARREWGDNPRAADVYRQYWTSIRDHVRRGPAQTLINVRWSGQGATPPHWRDSLMPEFEATVSRFKINYSHSYLLVNRETEEHRYFHASLNNARVLESPVLIQNRPDFDAFLLSLNDTDALEFARRNRPDTKWSVLGIASTSFYFTPLDGFPIGAGERALPDWVRNNRYVRTVTLDERNNPVKDKLCFFRCLCLHLKTGLADAKSFALRAGWTADRGVTLTDLPALEGLFKVAVDVFEVGEDRKVVPRRRSGSQEANRMRLFLYNDHFCYVTDFDKAVRSIVCPKCGKLWREEWQYRRHEATCAGTGQRNVYPGGVYRLAETPLERLKDDGIRVPDKYVYPYRATFDLEALQVPVVDGEKRQSETTQYVGRHVPMSVSVCSNVPGYVEPRCFVSDGEPQRLVDQMMDYLREIARRAFSLLKDEFEESYEDIPGDRPDLKKVLDTYLRQLPVIGFNSSSYDLNLIKSYLFGYLIRYGAVDEDEEEEEEEEEDQKDEQPIRFLVKQNNAFKCVSTVELKFLDVKNFIAPNFSYAKYLAAFDVRERKSHFPYEYVRDLAQLDETSLPPREAFASSLRGSTISEEEYETCRRTWIERGMSTLRDWLVYYNNLDVKPFLEALEKQTHFYRALGLDMLKDGIGIPGLCLRYLFKTLPDDVFFSLIGSRQKDLHQLIRGQLVGGPSLVFHRLFVKGETRLRNGPKLARSLIGYDANSLYLWALMQEMPTEHPVDRKKESNFRAERVDKFGQMAREWLTYLSHTKDVHIRHKFNGPEKSLGDRHIRVDGWDGSTVYQFHGCLFHGHVCRLTRGCTVNPINGRLLSELRSKTEEITQYLLGLPQVASLEVMWECQWRDTKANDYDLKCFVEELCPTHRLAFSDSGLEVDLESVVAAVLDGRLFGLVQCDLEVPEALRDKFQEFQPVFKNTAVSREDAGPFMRRYCEQHELVAQPRRSLIGSYFGKAILLATPLLKWYLKHGLVMSDVQRIVEYRPRACFETFGQTVCDARRTGDSDPNKAILADSFKLLGNAAYGKTITNIANHRDVRYVQGAEVGRIVNNPLFRVLTPLDGGLCEVESGKKTLRWDLPLQIGFFVYQYAKLRMLEFYYDLLDTFVPRDDFQLAEMDTDSLYMALSTDSLEEAVRPELRERFFREYALWFPGLVCDEHIPDLVAHKVHGAPEPPADRPCCSSRRRYDKRRPGVFKEEFRGDGMVCLCSKTYYCFGARGDKLSSKGLSQSANRLTKERYLQVLETQESGSGVNRGFRTDGRTVYTYHQARKSLSFVYLKRRVCDDGISTMPTLL